MSKPQQVSPRVPNHKCCGVVGESKSKTRKNKQRPQPWFIRKIWILFTLGIMGYSGYAYIARLCLPMIKRTQGALGSQATGIVLLIFFSILYLWMIWAYFKVVVTSPGFARDHVEKTQRPPLADLPAPSYYNSPFHQDGVPPPSETVKSDSIEEQKRSLSEKASQTNGSAHPQDSDLGAGPSYEQMLRSDSRSSNAFHAKEPSAGVLDGIVQLSLSTDDKPSAPSAAGVSQQNHPTSEPVAPSRLDARQAKRLSKQAARNSRLDQLNIFRKPPSTPILQPVFRYCDSDEIIKPNRTHHCSSCGTCVLRYDHHCPWIGQCVGARNHKFFLNFCFATSFFTAFVLASSLPFIVRSLTDSHGGIEPHFIALLALAALFWIFTTALCVSHVRLITHGQTTVESMQIRDIRDRDDQTLARGFAWWECRAKEKRRKAFDEEWGSVNTEGNIWWRGSPYQEWQDVMGKRWLGWIFPLGGQFGDDHGLTYPINPRFDEDGRLRKRSEWPEDMR